MESDSLFGGIVKRFPACRRLIMFIFRLGYCCGEMNMRCCRFYEFRVFPSLFVIETTFFMACC